MDLGWIVTYASPTNPIAQIGISPGEAVNGEQVRPYLTIEIDDVDAVHADALTRSHDGVHPLTDEPWGVRRFFVVEPGGLVLNILGQTTLAIPDKCPSAGSRPRMDGSPSHLRRRVAHGRRSVTPRRRCRPVIMRQVEWKERNRWQHPCRTD